MSRVLIAPIALFVASASCRFDTTGMGSDRSFLDDGGARDAPASDATSPLDAPTTTANDVAVAESAPTDAPDAEGDALDAGSDTGCSGVLHGKSCYFVLAAELDWYAARDACKAAGGHLVTIGDSAENDAVKALASAPRFIGFRKPSAEPSSASAFAWVTGETASYTAWADEEPSGSGSCATIDSGGRWADESCLRKMTAICERE